MKTIVPNYYKNFSCIADKCHHNCCIGWEIDIDEDTLEKYKSAKGKFSRKLKLGIEINDESACFKLDGKGRCVFLNENNLCEIILNYGENSLCQICADHPRFRNFFSDRTEIGLGLCCEEAARIILSQKEHFSLVTIFDDKENEQLSFDEENVIKLRNEMFEILQSPEKSLQEKVDTLLRISGNTLLTIQQNEWSDFLLTLERLDDYWTVILNNLKTFDISNIILPREFDFVFVNLLLYFIYRHINEISTQETIQFVIWSYSVILNICKAHICKYGNIEINDIIEYSRMYSSEIEYSDENVEKIIEYLQKNKS